MLAGELVAVRPYLGYEHNADVEQQQWDATQADPELPVFRECRDCDYHAGSSPLGVNDRGMMRTCPPCH